MKKESLWIKALKRPYDGSLRNLAMADRVKVFIIIIIIIIIITITLFLVDNKKYVYIYKFTMIKIC